MNSLRIFAVFFGSSLIVLVACGPKPQPIPGRSYNGVLFGKPYHIEAVGDSTDYTASIDSIIHAYESNFNMNDPRSTVSRYNAFSRKDTVFAFYDSSRAFGIVYDLTSDLHRRAMDYYDPTLNPLKRAWIVARSGGGVEPNLDSLYNFVGYDGAKMDLNEMMEENYQYRETNMRKADPRIEVDFTTIAAAVAMDHVGELLKLRGCSQYRISYDRGIITYGSTIDSLNIIPLGVMNDTSDQYIRMQNGAFSFRNAQDKMLLIDPTYGYPADNEMAYVAISAPSLAEAEAFSEAFVIMGLEKATQYYNKNEDSRIESFMFYTFDKTLHSASTEGFDSMILLPDSVPGH